MATTSGPAPAYWSLPGAVAPGSAGPGPPPDYLEVVDPNAAPPTYESLFGPAGKRAGRGGRPHAGRLARAAAGALGTALLTLLLALLPLAMVALGAAYLHECRLGQLPALLVAAGALWAAKNALLCYNRACRGPKRPSEHAELRRQARQPAADSQQHQQQQQHHHQQQLQLHLQQLQLHADDHQQHQHQDCHPERQLSASSICNSLLTCLLLGCFLAGCVLVLRNHPAELHDLASSRYCHRVVYTFAFWLLACALGAAGALLCALCCALAPGSSPATEPELGLAASPPSLAGG